MMNKLVIAALFLVSAPAAAQRIADPVLESLKNEKDSVVLNQKLEMLGKGTEEDLTRLMNFYQYNVSKKDSIAKLILQRFPKGNMAFRAAQRGLYREDDPAKREQAFMKMKEVFPQTDLDLAYSAVSGAYAEGRNVGKVREYQDKIRNVTAKAITTANNARVVLNYNPAAAESLMKPEIERLSKTAIPEDQIHRGNYLAMFNLYGAILTKEGKYGQALPYVQVAYANIPRRDDELSSNYGLVLNKNGRHQEALPLLEKLVSEGIASIDIKKAFMQSYELVNSGKSAKYFLADADHKLKIGREAAIGKMLMNEPAPDFVVKDIDGKTVSLADFKGKTVVLDFWATWCAPCKKSFPFMQTVVNNYKNDPNVKFLFIHTRETAADPLSDAKNYLKANHYNFDLYMDMKDPVTHKNEAVNAFEAKGIPAKFVIDGKGIIRFKLIGFSGGDEPAILELSSMIDITKKNS